MAGRLPRELLPDGDDTEGFGRRTKDATEPRSEMKTAFGSWQVTSTAGHGEASRVESRQRANGFRWPVLVGLAALLVPVVATAAFLAGRAASTRDGAGAAEEADPSTLATEAVPTSATTSTPDNADEAGTDLAGTDIASELGRNAAGVVAFDVRADGLDGAGSASGLAELRFDVQNREICYSFKTAGIDEPFEARIRRGRAEGDGGVVVDFGSLDSLSIGCTPVPASDLTAVLNNPSNHYIEMNDEPGEVTVRARLSDANDPTQASSGELAAPDPEAAVLVISAGQMTYRGVVADEETAARLMSELEGGHHPAAIAVVDELEVLAGAPPPSNDIVVDASLLFAVGSDIMADEEKVLPDLSELFLAHPDWTMTIVGHTDSTGAPTHNQELSLRRANAVRRRLIELGVPSRVLATVGAGDTQPIGDNNTDEGRAQNRRIEFRVERG